MKSKQKWELRSFGTDFIAKGLFWIILFVVILFSFNYLISRTLYASEFWDMVGGVLALIAAFIALIIFARRALIEGYYISSFDYVMSTFSTEVQKDESFSKLYHAILEKYDKDLFGLEKALQPLQTHFLNLCFKDYMENLNWLEKFVICLYSTFTVGKFSINLELSRARRRNWFEDRINDFF